MRGERQLGSHHGVPPGGVSEASGSHPREAASVSVVGVLGGEEREGPRRTPIPTWAQTDRWTGDTLGLGGSTHLSNVLPPSPTAPLSLVRSCSSPLFFFAPPHSKLYPCLWDCMSPTPGSLHLSFLCLLPVDFCLPLSGSLFLFISESLLSLILYHYSHYISLSASLSGSLSPLFGILSPYLESLHHSISFSVSVTQSV